MLNERDSSSVLDRIRHKMADSGFEVFDEHAFQLMRSELGQDGRRIDAGAALRKYVEIVQSLLRSVGADRVARAKRKLSDLLCEGEEIEIVLDTRSLGYAVRREGDTWEEALNGFAEADKLADGLDEILVRVERFDYSDPDPEPSGGGPSP